MGEGEKKEAPMEETSTGQVDIDGYQKGCAETAVYPSELDLMIAKLGRIAEKLPQEYNEVSRIRGAKKALLDLRVMPVIDRLCPEEMLHENLDYLLDGLTSEVGELCSKVKKVRRDKHGQFLPEDVAGVKKELGDVQWYSNRIASLFGFLMSGILRENREKLLKRKEEGKVQGSGDNR